MYGRNACMCFTKCYASVHLLYSVSVVGFPKQQSGRHVPPQHTHTSFILFGAVPNPSQAVTNTHFPYPHISIVNPYPDTRKSSTGDSPVRIIASFTSIARFKQFGRMCFTGCYSVWRSVLLLYRHLYPPRASTKSRKHYLILTFPPVTFVYRVYVLLFRISGTLDIDTWRHDISKPYPLCASSLAGISILRMMRATQSSRNAV